MKVKAIKIKEVEGMIYLKSLSAKQRRGIDLSENTIARIKRSFQNGFDTLVDGDIGGATPDGNITTWSTEEIKNILDRAGFQYEETVEEYVNVNF